MRSPDRRRRQHEGPFLVFAGGQLVPIDGPYRVAELTDGWYVIGENSTLPCGSERAAHDALAALVREHDPHARVREALADLDPESS